MAREREDDTSRTASGHEGTESETSSTALDAVGQWFAMSAARLVVLLVGVVLLLFALGKLVGMNLLELFVSALSSPTGTWLVVSLFALFLIVAATRWAGPMRTD